VFGSQTQQAVEIAWLGLLIQDVIVIAFAYRRQSLRQALPMLRRGEDMALELSLKTEVVMELIGAVYVFERFVGHVNAPIAKTPMQMLASLECRGSLAGYRPEVSVAGLELRPKVMLLRAYAPELFGRVAWSVRPKVKLLGCVGLER
jgi:hypothetical protein